MHEREGEEHAFEGSSLWQPVYPYLFLADLARSRASDLSARRKELLFFEVVAMMVFMSLLPLPVASHRHEQI
jgi:hypothetical protein